MPLYDLKCKAGHLFERAIPLSKFDDPIFCSCGAPAFRCISKPRILRPIDYSYDCPITGKHITSKYQHEENLKVQGCRIRETGERDYNARRRAEADAQLEKAVDETVEREIASYSSEKRERLWNELEGGMDVSIERR